MHVSTKQNVYKQNVYNIIWGKMATLIKSVKFMPKFMEALEVY